MDELLTALQTTFYRDDDCAVHSQRPSWPCPGAVPEHLLTVLVL